MVYYSRWEEDALTFMIDRVARNMDIPLAWQYTNTKHESRWSNVVTRHVTSAESQRSTYLSLTFPLYYNAYASSYFKLKTSKIRDSFWGKLLYYSCFFSNARSYFMGYIFVAWKVTINIRFFFWVDCWNRTLLRTQLRFVLS